ncbi:hypothetical protein [Vibrio sonorensis]|uniref:hypothetical protein n=1 Tax=Vibrio sonorensis TaxID=1004316 RepID=UPI0008D940E6|nr:hypothetical protein [Vibrio sonorensis]
MKAFDRRLAKLESKQNESGISEIWLVPEGASPDEAACIYRAMVTTPAPKKKAPKLSPAELKQATEGYKKLLEG